MAKKTISFSLEDDIIKLIEDYKKSKNLSSRSTALERLLLNRETSVDTDTIRAIVKEMVGENTNVYENNKTKTIDEVEQRSIDAIENAFNDMPYE